MHTIRAPRLYLLLCVSLFAFVTGACTRQPAALIPTPLAMAGATATPPVTAPAEPAGPLPTARPTALPLPSATPLPSASPAATPTPTATATPSPTPTPTHPMMIEVMRRQSYPGSALTLVERVEPGDNYDRYVVSYESEGNTIYALLTVPWGTPPESGWPIIIFNHGYIPPEQYRTTERYVDYVDGFARSGYIVFRSDYRGHGNSEGEPVIAYRSPAYAADVLNGMAAVKTHPAADPGRIGMWGHSMGGFITLQAMVVSPEIKAGVVWGGVVVSIPDLFTLWRRGNPDDPTPTPDPTREERRRQFWGEWYETWGTPEENPAFWASISPNSYLSDLSGPLQIHHARGDASVPYIFSEMLYEQVAAAGMPGELYLYEGDNHNIAVNFGTAMARSVAFFDRHVKNGPE